MSDFVVKVSLPGIDVKLAKPEQCSIHSEYPPFKSKVDQTDPHFALLKVDFTGSVTQDSVTNLYSFPHGYNYIPLSLPSMVFISNDGDLFAGTGTIRPTGTLEIYAKCTATHFIVTIYDNFNWTGPNASLEVSYYVFAEDGA